ncbi:MAG: hypothetical protein AAGK02_00755 [Pseudomonadota bacterium]
MTDAMTNPIDTTAPAVPDHEAGRQAARESFHGRGLTDGQFQEAWAIAGIIHGKIHQTGSFRDPLTDYAHAFARAQKFDALRGEAIIRDVYAGRQGQTMDQTRKQLDAAAEALPDIAKTRALDCAEAIGQLIQAPPTQPFYKAYDRAAVTLAKELNITQTGAKALMKEVFEAHHQKDLYAHGKEIEAAYHKPVRDAEIAERKAEQSQSRSRSQSRA